MSKQSPAPPSRAGAEEQSSTGVIDPPKDVDKKKLVRERDQAKERQKDRLGGLEPEQLIDLYRQMILIRRFEEKAAEVYVAGKIGGFCHLYIGQEAVAVGAISAIGKDDYVIASYREHGHALAKGMSARSIMAELYGKVTGCSKGKGGSMHMFDKELDFLGGHGIVGGQIPLATGTAFASKYQGNGQGHTLLFRRSRREPGRVSRVAQHGPALETSLHLHLRKQSVRNGHVARARDVVA